MARQSRIKVDAELNKKSEQFKKNLNSEMYFKSDFVSELMSLNWLEELEKACPYLENIVVRAKVALYTESAIVKIEKAKKTSVDSVKDLTRHTHYIDKINAKTQDVEPSKLLITFPEETYNTYENRFLYTLIDTMNRFVLKKQAMLEDIEAKSTKTLEYVGSTKTSREKVSIEFKVLLEELPEGQNVSEFKKEIQKVKARLKKVKDYLTGWQRSEMIKALNKLHVPFVIPPIRKTNLILKNPNFQVATKLWTFLQTYDEDLSNSSDSSDSVGNDVLKGILDDSFLMDYFVLDSIYASKRKEKEQLKKYAAIMIKQQLQRVVMLMLNSGIKITEEQILSMVTAEIKDEKNKVLVGSADIKDKFKSAIDEYLERTQDYL